jgi:hypothetical protein
MSVPMPDVSFTKFVSIWENVHINKDIDVHADVRGNTAMANATADAMGANSVTETLTQTTVAQHIGSSSASESLSAATQNHYFHLSF